MPNWPCRYNIILVSINACNWDNKKLIWVLDLPYFFCLVHECVQNWNDLFWDVFHFVSYTFTLALGMQYVTKLCKIKCPCAHDIVHSKGDTTILDLVAFIFHHNCATIQSLEPRKRTRKKYDCPWLLGGFN